MDFNVRCEWGLNGLKALSQNSDLVIIVDVLSFSTCVEIATSQDAIIFPYRFHHETADAFAREKNAIAASKRGTSGTYTLSPASLLTISAGTRLVLPSPNGSEISLAASGKPTVAGCLRNARAVAEYAKIFESIAVIPCGERWKDGSLRPALEDWLGAGAIIAYLRGTKSPEALLAQAAFEKFETELENIIMHSVSGIELFDRGFQSDIVLASSFNVSSTVPELIGGEYRKAFAKSGV